MNSTENNQQHVQTKDIKERIYSSITKNGIKPEGLIQDFQELCSRGGLDEQTVNTLTDLKDYPNYRKLASAVLDNLIDARQKHDQSDELNRNRVEILLELSKILAIDMFSPQTAAYLQYIRRLYPYDKRFFYASSHNKTLSRRALLIGGVGVTAATIAGLSNQKPTISPGNSAEVVSSNQRKQTANNEVLQLPSVNEQERPENFTELFAPVVRAANKVRAEKRDDPSYLHRVDKELNMDRVNIVLSGYRRVIRDGQTVVEPDSPIILSLNLTSQTIDAVLLDANLIAPEVQRLSYNGNRFSNSDKLGQAYNIGGFSLLEEVIENSTGLSADLMVVFDDNLIQKIIDNGFGEIEVSTITGERKKLSGAETLELFTSDDKNQMHNRYAIFEYLAQNLIEKSKYDKRLPFKIGLLCIGSLQNSFDANVLLEMVQTLDLNQGVGSVPKINKSLQYLADKVSLGNPSAQDTRYNYWQQIRSETRDKLLKPSIN